MKKRYLYLFTGVMMLLLCSIPYSWSMISVPLSGLFGWPAKKVSFTFTIAIASFCIGSACSGIMIKRFGALVMNLFGIISLVSGFYLMCSLQYLWQLYLGYGILLCLGTGIIYNSVMTNVLQCFDDRAGICSGILLMGFGFGSSLIGGFANISYEQRGFYHTMVILAAFIITVQILGTLILPGKSAVGNTSEGLDLSMTKRMLSSASFRCYFIWSTMMGATALVVVGNSCMIAGEIITDNKLIITCAGMISVFNGIGRILYGGLLDQKGSKWILRVVTGTFLVSEFLLLISLACKIPVLLMIGYILLGAGYGGIFTCNSAYIRRVFGNANYAIHFSIMNMSLLLASFIGPTIATRMLEPNAAPAILLMLLLTVAAGVVLQGVKKHISTY